MIELTSETQFNKWLDLHRRRRMSGENLSQALTNRHEVETVNSSHHDTDQLSIINVTLKDGGQVMLHKSDLESFFGGDFRITKFIAGTEDYDFSRRDNRFMQVTLTTTGSLTVAELPVTAHVEEETIIVVDDNAMQFASRTMPIDFMVEAVEQAIRNKLETQLKLAETNLARFNQSELY